MIRKILSKLMYLSFFLFLVFSSPSFVLAQTTLLPAGGGKVQCEDACSADVVSGACKKYCGAYSLNDIVQVGIDVTQILLALSGSVALLFFIYGGITFLISGGSSEKVSQGKQIIVNSVIGLLIIFSSFIIIQFTMTAMGFTQDTSLFGTWNQSKS